MKHLTVEDYGFCAGDYVIIVRGAEENINKIDKISVAYTRENDYTVMLEKYGIYDCEYIRKIKPMMASDIVNSLKQLIEQNGDFPAMVELIDGIEVPIFDTRTDEIATYLRANCDGVNVFLNNPQTNAQFAVKHLSHEFISSGM